MRHDVVVIGGGQAGLAVGWFLARQGRRFTILEAGDAPAAAWRQRWDSLRLFTPARYDGLPGLAFPGDPDRYPTRDEVVAYLTEYARHFALPVELSSRVTGLRRDGAGYLVELEDRTEAADSAGETVDILLDVTHPGRWMAHCHIAEHHESMMLTFDVVP